MQNVKLNLIPGSVMPVVNVSQYDAGRQFSLSVYEGAASYSLTGKSVQIRGTKPDGNGFAYDSTDGAISVSGNVVTVTTLQQMTAVGGQTMVELRITSGSTVLGTLNFVLDVEHSALSDDTPISETDIPAIERDFQAALEEAQEAAETATTKAGEASTSATNAAGSATSAAADALKAEGYAVGKQNGSPVGSGSPYYHNNAEYHDTHAGEQAYNASQSATAAGNSATAAAADSLEAEGWAVGEQGGTPVGPTSPYYENNAKYYCQQSPHTALTSLTDVNISSPSNDQVLKYDNATQKWVNGTGGGGASDLDDLTDVTLTSPTSGQALVYDGSKWVNGSVSTVGDLDDLTDVDITTPADGDLLQYNGTSGEWENSDEIPNAVAALEETGAVNLCKNEATSQSIDNITYTVNADGSVSTNNNTATARSYFTIFTSKTKFKPRKYYLSGCPSGGGWSAFALYLRTSTDGLNWSLAAGDIGSGGVLDLTEEKYIKIEIYVENGVSIGGKTFYPMLALTPGLPYHPYAMTNRELTEQNTPDSSSITSINTNSYYSLSGTGYLVKNGHIAELYMQIKCASVSSSWVEIISTGIIPIPFGAAGGVSASIAAIGGGTAIDVNISPTGKLLVSSGQQNKYYNILFTYIC